MKKILKISFFLIVTIGYSQSDCEKYTEKYIPIDLEDAFAFFECNWSKEDLETFKNTEEESATISLHRGFGMNIRNGWGLWKREGKLVEFLSEKGIYHPEDMSAVIFTSFHRKLNNKPIELEKQAEFYQEYWKKVNERQRKEYSKEFEKFKVNDTLNFKYLREYISKEQKELAESGKCIAKGILLEKRESDFYLKIKLIESCDEKGLYTGLDWGEPNRRITKVGDVEWIYYNDWESKIE
ncbi:DUF6794 domain-containing protein [Mesoflavibacter zeaxanthinifaciens]|uniref:DUF6794 domain-containing protein n=1 Tax=Mesoflavibacter zeaxanthinifaciens TaxID=393060 RepID=UPI00041D924B|nr:DUF6794 domain-containing protein [Mesoflavibacter zeaxanthinifaciens]